MSFFQRDTLEIENPQSREEDEEVEEQRRRQEELTDLLAAGIHAFNYDESTMNSSATSVEGVEQISTDQLKNGGEFNLDSGKKSLSNISSNLSDVYEQNYKDTNQQDQLKVLYEVRGREIKKLINELNQYKEEKSKEINILKNKVTLSEAEIRHLQISLSNAETLLVEKTDTIRNLKNNLSSKELEIDKLKKIIDELKLEVCTYSSTVSELQLKLSDNNPFSAEARKFKSDELQKAHQDQIIRLESLLQEQSKKTQILEKQKSHLEEEMKKIIIEKNTKEEENNVVIMELSKKLQSSQQQCKDLYLLGEAIKKESDHFKERLQLDNANFNFSSDYMKTDMETLVVHLEKLKKMLLDKDVEMNTLKAKLKFYNSDLDELFEYRKLLNKIYSYEVKPCSNMEHEELIIFMQRQLQSYQQAVEDRNNQIMNLNMVNKELQEKIEEMIQQTRTDIQNLSQKYSLPQLETMSNELQNAEHTINNLEKQLLEKEEICKSIQKDLEEVQKNYQHLQQTSSLEKQNFIKKMSELKEDLKRAEEEKNVLENLNEEMKKSQLMLINENAEFKSKLQNIFLKIGLSEADILESDIDIHEIDSLKSKYGHVHDQLCQVADHLEKLSPKEYNHNHNISIIFQLRKNILSYLNLIQNQGLDKTEIEEKLKHWNKMLKEFISKIKNDSPAKNESLTASHSENMQLQDKIQELINTKTLLEGEKCNLEYQLKTRSDELENAKKEIEVLTNDKNYMMKNIENNGHTIQNLHDQVTDIKKCLKIVEENKMEIEKQLQNTQKQLNEAKQENINLHKEITEINENMVKKNLFKELKDVENMIEQERGENDISGSEIFKKCVQAEILKAELLLRERLEEENIEKMQKIEEHYKNVLTQKTETHNKEKEKWKNQEAKYRKQFAAVLEECGRKIEELEKENMDLMKQTNQLFNEYKTFRTNIVEDIQKYKKLITDYQNKIEVLNKKWSDLFEFYSYNFTNIQKQNQKKIKNLKKTINMNETEIHRIESIYDEKIKKFQSEWQRTN